MSDEVNQERNSAGPITGVSPSDTQTVPEMVPSEGTPEAGVGVETEEERKKRSARERTARYRQLHPNWSRRTRSHHALQKEQDSVDAFWKEVEVLRNWTDSMFGYEVATLQYFSTVMAVLLVEAVKYAERKANAIKDDSFLSIYLELECFYYFWVLFLEHGPAVFAKRSGNTAPQRGSMIVSQWSALMENGLASDYMKPVRECVIAKFGVDHIWNPSMYSEKDDMVLVNFLMNPSRQPGDSGRPGCTGPHSAGKIVPV